MIPASTIRDVGKDHVLEHMCHLPQIMVECGDTSLLVIMNHRVLLGPVLGGLETPLQVVIAGPLALQVQSHPVHRRIISNREAREQVRFFRTQLGKVIVPNGMIVKGWTIM